MTVTIPLANVLEFMTCRHMPKNVIRICRLLHLTTRAAIHDPMQCLLMPNAARKPWHVGQCLFIVAHVEVQWVVHAIIALIE